MSEPYPQYLTAMKESCFTVEVDLILPKHLHCAVVLVLWPLNVTFFLHILPLQVVCCTQHHPQKLCPWTTCSWSVWKRRPLEAAWQLLMIWSHCSLLSPWRWTTERNGEGVGVEGWCSIGWGKREGRGDRVCMGSMSQTSVKGVAWDIIVIQGAGCVFTLGCIHHYRSHWGTRGDHLTALRAVSVLPSIKLPYCKVVTESCYKCIKKTSKIIPFVQLLIVCLWFGTRHSAQHFVIFVTHVIWETKSNTICYLE